jgi:LPXTG-motif cell wall-anchored protein
MYQKLFQITIVLFLVIVSVAMVGLVATVIMSAFRPTLLAESGGISAVAGGVSESMIGYMVIAASLIIAGFYLFFRRRRFRR